MNSFIYRRLLLNLNIYVKSKIAKKIQFKELKFFNINKSNFNDHNLYTTALSEVNLKNKIANFLSNQSLLKTGENKENSSNEFSENINNHPWFKLLSIPLGVFVANYFNDSSNKKFFCEEKEKNTNDGDTIPTIKRPYLGCSIRKKDDGMQVIMVKAGSPAELSGLKITDIILKINEHEVHSIEDYYFAIGLEKGEKKLKIKRLLNNNNSDLNLEYKIFEVSVVFE